MTEEISRYLEEIAVHKLSGGADLVNSLNIVGKRMPVFTMMAKNPIVENMDHDWQA